MILECDDVRKKFEKFLLSKGDLTSRDIYLILSYLCHIEFGQAELLELLKRSPQMKEIMEVFEKTGLSPELIGYYGVMAEQVSKIVEPNVTEQIRLRVLCELKGEYSVALNHLLNEIHAICGILDEKATGADMRLMKWLRFLTTRTLPMKHTRKSGNCLTDAIKALFPMLNCLGSD